MRLSIHLPSYLHLPSFWDGVAQVLDFSWTVRNRDFLLQDPAEVDAEAMRNDWENVGGDLAAALDAAREGRM